MIGAPYLIFNVDMELLQVCGLLLMAIVLQFFLCLHEPQRLVISVNDFLLHENVVLPLSTSLYNEIHLFIYHRWGTYERHSIVSHYNMPMDDLVE
jgi:hypothetical protein